MDKALETTYTMRGVHSVTVRTEPTGTAAKTQAKHTKACKEAHKALYMEANAPIFEFIDDAIENPPTSYGVEQYRKGQREHRKRLERAAEGKAQPLPDPYAWRKPYTPLRRTYSDAELEQYHTPEPEPVAEPELVAEVAPIGDAFEQWLAA